MAAAIGAPEGGRGYDPRRPPDSGWRQVALVVRQESLDARRNRRALAIVLLYVLVAVLTMNGFIRSSSLCCCEPVLASGRYGVAKPSNPFF